MSNIIVLDITGNMYRKLNGGKISRDGIALATNKKGHKIFDRNSELHMKIILLGNIGSGKSSLVKRYIENDYQESRQSSIGVAHYFKRECLKGQPIRVNVWDTTGDERYRSLTRLYYRDAKAAIICFDLTDRSSWEAVPYWVEELSDKEDCVMYLVGTKRDLTTNKLQPQEKVVTRGEINHLRDSHPRADIRRVCETSSKTGEFVDLLFHDAAADFVDEYSLSEELLVNYQTSLSLTGSQEKKSTCCGR